MRYIYIYLRSSKRISPTPSAIRRDSTGDDVGDSMLRLVTGSDGKVVIVVVVGCMEW